MGHLRVNLNNAVKLANPENRTIEPNITTICVQLEFWRFKKFPHGRHCNFVDFSINQLNIKFKFSHVTDDVDDRSRDVNGHVTIG